MDIISFNEAATANSRIENFIENPDSTSGVLTVPKTIAAGETITIPTGRVAILPDLQVDGDLVVDGDLFIPTGSMTSQVVQKVASTDNAVVRFDGVTGQVQNSGVIIDDNNNVGIGVIPSAWTTYKAIDLSSNASISEGYGNVAFSSNCYGVTGGGFNYKNSSYATRYNQVSGTHQWFSAPSGTAGNPITWTNAMILDTSGNLLVGANTAGSGATSGFNVSYPTNTTVCSIGHTSGTASLTSYMTFSYNGTVIGNIYQSGTTAVTYNTTSDYRLKENIRPSDCKRFMDIKFVDYERIDGRHECGVIAHELQEIYPDLVTGEKDATEIRKVEISPAVEEVKDEDGNIIVEAVEATYEEQEFPVYQQVNYMGLIARIGTVVQQQAKLIEAMQLEINELKGVK